MFFPGSRLCWFLVMVGELTKMKQNILWTKMDCLPSWQQYPFKKPDRFFTIVVSINCIGVVQLTSFHHLESTWADTMYLLYDKPGLFFFSLHSWSCCWKYSRMRRVTWEAPSNWMVVCCTFSHTANITQLGSDCLGGALAWGLFNPDSVLSSIGLEIGRASCRERV